MADLATARREAEEARARLLAADTARERSYAMEDCVVALEALLAATAEPAAVSIIHACPVSGHALTPCCGRSPFDIPSSDRITLNAAVVTCRRQEAEPAPALPEEVREAAEAFRKVNSAQRGDSCTDAGCIVCKRREAGDRLLAAIAARKGGA